MTALSQVITSDYEFRDPEMNDARVKWKAAMDVLTDRQREQVLWVAMAIPKAWDRIGHSCSDECRPAVAAHENALLADLFKRVVDEVVYWIGVRHAEDHPGTTLTVDDRLDLIDKASRWLKSRGVGGLPKPIRKMLAEAEGVKEIARRVAREMRSCAD